MSANNVTKLCEVLKTEAKASGDASRFNQLKLRILDYFIEREVGDDIFEDVLKARINDPDPAKEESKIICSQILEAWQSRNGS